MKRYLVTAALILSACQPTFAGGIVIEDAYEAEPQVKGRANWIVPVAILLIIAAAASGGSKGGTGNCNGPDDVPPTPEPC